ncbi:MAG: TIGR03086 family metal-binding protein [Acidimicrobiales bacterium]
MTNATRTSTDTDTHARTRLPTAASDLPFAPDDPRVVFAKAVSLAGWVIDAVTPDQLGLPTPCDDYDVRGLLGHVVDVMARVRLIGEGSDPMANSRVDVTTVADDGWFDLFRGRAHEVQVAWTDPAALERTVVLPWATSTGAGALASYTSELTVHTWDLARATGLHPAWDDQVVAVGYGAITRGLPASGRLAMFEAFASRMPAEARPTSPPFGEAVEVPADAPAIDRLVAWTGRQP